VSIHAPRSPSNLARSFVPEGTSAVVHTYSLHHDPRYFSPFPDNFIPERWLASEDKIALDPTIFSEHEVIHNTAAFIPFSVGPSNCVGRNLAYQVNIPHFDWFSIFTDSTS
jgi:cytochrome P450